MAQNVFHGIDGYLIIYHGTGDISSKAMEALSVSRSVLNIREFHVFSEAVSRSC